VLIPMVEVGQEPDYEQKAVDPDLFGISHHVPSLAQESLSHMPQTSSFAAAVVLATKPAI
jgi:hypothetical protein